MTRAIPIGYGKESGQAATQAVWNGPARDALACVCFGSGSARPCQAQALNVASEMTTFQRESPLPLTLSSCRSTQLVFKKFVTDLVRGEKANGKKTKEKTNLKERKHFERKQELEMIIQVLFGYFSW